MLILCSAAGALLNLIPFCFYDLKENKYLAYVDVLNFDKLEEDWLVEAMDIIFIRQRENAC